MLNKDDIKSIYIVGSIFLFAIFYGFYYNIKLKKDGVFVIAKVYDIKNGKNSSAKCIYFYSNKKYINSFRAFGLGVEINQLIYIKISSKRPTLINAIDFAKIEVPKCFDLNSTPFHGWKEIPKDTCK